MDLPTTGVPTPVSPLAPSPIGNPVGVAFIWDYWTGLQITMNPKLVQSLISQTRQRLTRREGSEEASNSCLPRELDYLEGNYRAQSATKLVSNIPFLSTTSQNVTGVILLRRSDSIIIWRESPRNQSICVAKETLIQMSNKHTTDWTR